MKPLVELRHALGTDSGLFERGCCCDFGMPVSKPSHVPTRTTRDEPEYSVDPTKAAVAHSDGIVKAIVRNLDGFGAVFVAKGKSAVSVHTLTHI